MLDWESLRGEYGGRRVTVVGVGRSNTPLVDFLLRAGAVVSARDRKCREELGETAGEFEEKGVRLILGEGYLDGITEEVIFRTPGMRYDKPELAAAVARGAKLTSEMQLFFELCPCPIIGITGSDGKTTTTTLIAELLRAEGKRVFLGGNIGKPLLPEVESMTPSDYAVVELSSFQLHTMTLSPKIAVITNLSHNHLDYHTDMEEYRAAKENILRYQKPWDRAVLNYSNPYTRMAAEGAVGHVTFFSSGERPTGENPLYLEKDRIMRGNEILLTRGEIRLPGLHNVENYMAAIAALEGIVSPETIRRVAESFPGVEHRIEYVRELDGVTYYNSSIDSSPTRTMAALSAFGEKKLLVILGGYDKKIPYDPLGEPLCRHAKAVLLTGTTAEKIRAAILSAPSYREGAPAIHMASSLTEATGMAKAAALPGDTVLLSPASASFDAFKNFEERGCFFKKLVMGFEPAGK